VSIDPEVVAALRPMDVAAYLRSRRWEKVEDWPRGTMWVYRREDREWTALLPNDQSLADYRVRVGQTLATVAEVEERSPLEILADLTESTSDVIRITVRSEATAAGDIPLGQAVRVVDGARNMMLAAACSTLDPRPAYGPRKPDRALRYVEERVRLGQTQRGSFTVTVLSRVPPLLTPGEAGDLFPEHLEPPFERQVTRRLLASVEAVKAAAASTLAGGDVSVFRKGVIDGVSANLCQAISDMVPADGGRLLIRFGWAPGRPEVGLEARSLDLSADEGEVIAEAARVLMETSPRPDFELSGVVVQLERPEEAEFGVATVRARVDGQWRLVRVQLADEPYRRATQAHPDRRQVHLVGTLIKEGRTYQLRDVTSIDLENLP